VARLAESSGPVWLFNADLGEWVSAVRNRPLTTGDWLATDAGARAEVQVGATTVRLDGDTELELRAVDDEQISLQLHSGTVSTQLRDAADAAQFELVTDEGRFLAQRVGRYRFDRTASSSVVTVHAGAARYEGRDSALTIAVGRRAEFWIDAAGVAQYRLSEPLADAFAAWNIERDRERDREAERGTERLATTPYASRGMTGAEELDRYGRWEQDADLGALWIPRGVAADWVPYSTGHWAWIRPWGWTWVDDAPWGFAPFHYGRWVLVRNHWCWTPGRWVARPVYAPALVGWVGHPAPGASMAIGGGRAAPPVVGWFPLAPREVYVPSYRSSPGYARNVNITHVSNVNQITAVINNPQARREFENHRIPHAVTVVPVTVMTGRQPVAPAASRWRDTPGVRDIARQPAAGTVLLAAPVTPPAAPARGPGQRPGAGGPAAERGPNGAAVVVRPDLPPRSRDAVPVQSSVTPGQVLTSPSASPPLLSPSPSPWPSPPPAGAAPGVRAAPVVTPRPVVGQSPAVPARAAVSTDNVERPVVPPARATPETPTMRALPVYRGEERRPPHRPETPATPGAPGAVPVPVPVPAPRPVGPAQPVTIPAAAATPVVPPLPAATRPVDAPKPRSGDAKKVDSPARPRGDAPKEP
jgi:hypothetical protein